MDGDFIVPVTTEAELLDYLGKGWKLYFHKTVRRWYVYRGSRHRKIVSATLENLCEQLYTELSGGRESVPALEVQERRWQGQPIEGIADDVGLSRGAVYNALEKNLGYVIKPRERAQSIVTEETALEETAEARSHEEEKLEDNLLNPLIVGGILVGIPIGFLALWFLGNLAAGKLKV
jgi:hypothetical protein